MKKANDNAGLRGTYEAMHTTGQAAWFDDGADERELILHLGKCYWQGSTVLEIGCGEGELVHLMHEAGADCLGLDYSETAIRTAKQRFPHLAERFEAADYRAKGGLKPEILVMQGVLEHLDDPFGELRWMIDHFRPTAVITTSPGFLNPRGIVWMTLAHLGAVVSRTDLHYLHPWQFEKACADCDWNLDNMVSVDISWGWGAKMVADLKKRIPLALRDGGLPEMRDLDGLLDYLIRCGETWESGRYGGAVIGYRIIP